MYGIGRSWQAHVCALPWTSGFLSGAFGSPLMSISRRSLMVAAASFALAGCAGLRGPVERPRVSLESFRTVASGGVVPRFAIGLRVVNPNPTPLPLRGMSYAVDFEGRELITGVARDLETIPAFGESRVEVEAGVDLISGIGLLNDLIGQVERDHLTYTVRARLDGGGLRRLITLEENGELSIAALRGASR